MKDLIRVQSRILPPNDNIGWWLEEKWFAHRRRNINVYQLIVIFKYLQIIANDTK
ncbi:MAG: hypothetical protein GWP27_10745 [Bacteroidetes bacterium]|nr:hypothetical protein [Bacteroidota bacterium]